MLKINFYDEPIERERIIYVVITAFYNHQILLVKHKERFTWEIPGGHREQDESSYAAAKRELFEETGAVEFVIERICGYSVTRAEKESFGILFRADIQTLGNLPEFEIGEIGFFNQSPKDLTYPDIQLFLLKKALEQSPVILDQTML